MAIFRFLVTHSVTGAYLGYLDLQNVAWNKPVGGVGELTGWAYISDSQTRDRLATLLREDLTAIYPLASDRFWWGGRLIAAPWNPAERRREIHAVAWEGWLSQRIIGPDTSTNPASEVTYAYSATDQFTIAQDICNYATTGDGTPTIVVGSETSGVTRDLNWNGSDFKTAAGLINSMANRSNGFEWGIDVDRDTSGMPSLRLRMDYPAGGTTSGPALVCRKTPNGGNMSVQNTIEETAENRRTRVWATGTGTPPDQLMAFDDDPDLADDNALLTETVTNYSSTSAIDTLASDAQTERAYRGVLTNTIVVRVFFADIDPANYDSGDRAQLVYQDEGLDINYPAVRIVDRVMHVNSPDGADYAELTLDLSDSTLPDTDEGA